jgi:hypothetical protein
VEGFQVAAGGATGAEDALAGSGSEEARVRRASMAPLGFWVWWQVADRRS